MISYNGILTIVLSAIGCGLISFGLLVLSEPEPYEEGRRGRQANGAVMTLAGVVCILIAGYYHNSHLLGWFRFGG